MDPGAHARARVRPRRRTYLLAIQTAYIDPSKCEMCVATGSVAVAARAANDVHVRKDGEARAEGGGKEGS